MNEARIQRSRALTPLFFRGPYPENSDGKAPLPFQHAGAEYALAVPHCLIGDQPGVGKTLQGILISNAMEAKRTLVICPASLRRNWEREVWRWSMRENVRTYPVFKARDGVDLTADWVIMSYDLLRNATIFEALMSRRWDHLILDEAHAIKDPKGNKRTVAICAPDALPSVVGRMTLLSGTIMPNQPMEVYNAARLLCWDAIDRMSADAFRTYYYGEGGGMVRGLAYDEAVGGTVSKLHWSNKVRNQPRNLDELQQRLRGNFMIRRTKDEVLPQLPAKRYSMEPLDVTPDIRQALKHPGWGEVSKLYEAVGGDFDIEVPVDGDISTARRLLGEAKVGPICDLIDDLMADGVEKLLVTAHHTSVLAEARKRLAKYGLAYMDGATSGNKRQAEADKFMSRSDCRIILGQTQVIGEGWTLTAAQDCVLMEPDWVPGRIEQTVDRLHRQGQKGEYVLAHVPIVPGTLDERIIAKAIQKDAHIYEALDRA